MALYAISDLHLSLSVNKPMDIFGENWKDYMNRIKHNWLSDIDDDDYVLIPGDISWATYLDEVYEDFKYIESLPGVKIILKGNHDYWWTTVNKLNNYIKENNFTSIKFLYNNSILYDEVVICGTRGWISPDNDDFSQKDRKIYERELIRLELSLKEGLTYNPKKIIVAMHYPPFGSDNNANSEFVKLMKRYNVNICVYGHLHGESCNNAVVGTYNGIDFYLVSGDYINFKPLKLVD